MALYAVINIGQNPFQDMAGDEVGIVSRVIQWGITVIPLKKIPVPHIHV